MTGMWLLTNAGTDGLEPNEVSRDESEFDVVSNDACRLAGEAMSLGTSARNISPAVTPDRSANQRRKATRRGKRAMRQCPHCLSPMYPSHSCSVQPYAQTWVTKTWTSMEGDSVNHRMQLAQQAWLETRKHGLPQSLSRQFKKHRNFRETLQDWNLVAEGGALYYGIGQ